MTNDKPLITLGDWVVVCEDGLWGMINYIFRTKAEAIEDVSIATLDSRRTPKVKRMDTGVYWYYPKHVDTGTFGDFYIIQKVTKANFDYLRELIDSQWDEDPLSEYDDEEDV